MSFRTLKLELISFVPELNAVQAGLRLNRSYRHLLRLHPWSFIKAEGIVSTVAPYTTGTIAIAQGSTTVTGTGTGWTADHAGRWFRCGADDDGVFYIASVSVPGQTLTLESAWKKTAVTGESYTIFNHRYAKPTDCENILGVRISSLLSRTTHVFVDTLDPTRVSTGEPTLWLDIEDDVFELWPVPDAIYHARLWYNKTISDMSAESDTCLIPEYVVLAHARMATYMQVSGAEGGQRYANLIPIAQGEFAQLWQSAVEEDMRKLSLPTRVLVEGVNVPVSNEYWYSHDVLDPRGP